MDTNCITHNELLIISNLLSRSRPSLHRRWTYSWIEARSYQETIKQRLGHWPAWMTSTVTPCSYLFTPSPHKMCQKKARLARVTEWRPLPSPHRVTDPCSRGIQHCLYNHVGLQSPTDSWHWLGTGDSLSNGAEKCSQIAKRCSFIWCYVKATRTEEKQLTNAARNTWCCYLWKQLSSSS